MNSFFVKSSGFFLIFFMNHVMVSSLLELITREEWGAEPPKSTPQLLEEFPPPYVVVHHSALDFCHTTKDCKRLVKGIQQLHMVDNGWDDIGYNFLIGGDGNIYEGRGWGIHGAHVVKFNARSLGVCLLGNFVDKNPPLTQIIALKGFLLFAQKFNETIEDYHLIGHRQGSDTQCPGDKLYDIIEWWDHFDPDPN